jgi:transposase InsO family protein
LTKPCAPALHGSHGEPDITKISLTHVSTLSGESRSADTVGLVVRIRKELAGQGLDAGPDTICWHLRHHHQIRVSAATVSRYLTRHGLVVPEPRKRPKSSWIRFAAELPNQLWQSDFTHWQLAAGTETEILSWLDDHSRYALRVTAHQRVTGPIVRDAFRAAVAAHGGPAATLTDIQDV